MHVAAAVADGEQTLPLSTHQVGWIVNVDFL
jgi:hypothetical protein